MVYNYLHFLYRNRSARKRNRSGTSDLQYLIFREHLTDCIDLPLLASELDDDILLPDVDDLRPKYVHDIDDIRPALTIRPHLDHHELALYGLHLAEIDDLDDIDELRELVHDLLELLLALHRNDDIDAGDVRFLRIAG